MKVFTKLFTIIVVVIILLSSYFIFFTESEEEKKDSQPPKIANITGNTTGTSGKITTIYATFSDNVNITEAKIYYRAMGQQNWNSNTIINGSADIIIPKNSNENWQYYIIVNDAADNGPIGKPSNDGSKYYTIEVSSPAKDIVHNVFIEEGTVTWCDDCPVVRDILHSLYESGKYNFSYVSMVLDKNDKAEDRLKEDYKIYGYPTLFIDGGFSVFTNFTNNELIFSEAIKRAELRDAKKVNVTVNAKYLNASDEINTKIIIDNWEDSTYTGRLRVYLTEINSRWINQYSTEPKPYHYGFIDFIMNEQITIEAYETKNIELKKKIKDSQFSDLDPENLMIFAAVFNSEPIEKYAYPPDINPFNAYFADNSDASKVIEGGNLPPEASICCPEAGKLHLFGKPVINTPYRNTIIIGKTTVKTCVQDDNAIDKVEFFIDGELMKTDKEPPYEWTFNKIGLFRNIIRKHTIIIKVFDESGKTSTDSREFIAFFF